MQPNTNPNHPTYMPDNLKNRLSRVYFKKSQFTADDGKLVNYERLVLEVLIKGEVFEVSYKPEKNDKAILMLADNVEGEGLGINS